MRTTEKLRRFFGTENRYSLILNDINSISSELRGLKSIQIQSENVYIFRRESGYIVEYVVNKNVDKVLRMTFCINDEETDSIPKDIKSKFKDTDKVLIFSR